MSSVGVTLSPSVDESTFSAFRFDGIRSPHCSSEPILIYFAASGSPAVPLPVFESDSVASVKLRIQSCKGFVVKKQKIVFDGRELARDECHVKDYGVADGDFLHLVIRLSDVRAITVKTVCGKKFKFHIEQRRTVAYVKQQIAKKGDDFVNPADQRLIYDGEELDDQSLIKDIAEHDDVTIHLLVRKTAIVSGWPIEKDFELNINARDDIDAIARKLPVPDVWIEPFVVSAKVEYPLVIENLLSSILDGMEKGNPPVMSSEGTGGAYFMQDASGQEYLAVFKPIDEEPMAENNPQGLPLSSNGEGLKKGTRVGEGALREVAAYILDHPLDGHRSSMSSDLGFSGVPPTAMVRCLHGAFNHPKGFVPKEESFKIGSLQMYMKNRGSCEDRGPQAFPVQEVHKIAVLDMRLANADRHAGNILFCKEGEEGRVVLIPIDHGYCLPETFEDCTFEWLYWPQARQPFNAETIKYIKSLDAEQDITLLKFYGWDLSAACSQTLRISTMLLKKGAERGLTPYDIGSIMCRETLQKESKIEEMIREAKDNTFQSTSEAAFLEAISDIIDRHLDELAF